MIPLEEALEKLLSQIQPLPTRLATWPVFEEQILAEAIHAPHPLPRFDNSAMDGWAVRSSDTGPRRKVGMAPAGSSFNRSLGPGECVRVFTGSPLPAGADAVVMQEDAREEGDLVTILDAPKAWENVRFRGEDVKENALLAQAGERVTPSLCGLLHACGVARAKVYEKPLVAIFATGNELREPGLEVASGQIFESNRGMIAGLARKVGVPMIQPIVEDDLDATISALRDAADRYDAIITCGGVSVGQFDFVKEALVAGGGTLDFWRVAIKPGKPFVFGKIAGKPIFGLPGNPVSALVTFLLLVRPALLRMNGASNVAPPMSFGELAEDISNSGDRRHFIRVKMDAQGAVRSAGAQASHRLHSLAAANGLLDMPAETHWQSGRRVEVIRLD